MSGLKAPDTAEEVLQDVAEFRPEAPTCRMREPRCCRIIIIIITDNTSLSTSPPVSPLHLICSALVLFVWNDSCVHRGARAASGYLRNHSFVSCSVCRLQLCAIG